MPIPILAARSVRLLPVAVAALVLAVAPRPAAASPIACGDTLGAGAWLLETDLVCDSASGAGIAITLGSGADLDLGGHTVRMSIGGSGTPILIAGTGASLHGGTITSGSVGVQIQGGGGHRLRDLVLAGGLNAGIAVLGSSGNDIAGVQASGVAVNGVFLQNSNRNRLDRLTITDTNGIGPATGISFIGSDENSVTRSRITGTQCTGVLLTNSSRNVVCRNAVQDSFVFLNGPSANILIRDASSSNLICSNELSATVSPAVTSDGLNVGCKGGCHCDIGGNLSDPSTGASGNLVIGNRANGELRYGFAQSTGNAGNLYLLNQATGNGVANFAIDP